MKKKYIQLALFSLILVGSCKEKEDATGPVPASNVTAPAPANGATQAPVAAPQQGYTGSKSGVGLNPAHGEPGHRCEIPVGAPLDSKPSAPAVNTVQQPAVVPAPAPAPVPVNSTAAGALNPAHGQPGHRCDIAVGAPLNSKPSN